MVASISWGVFDRELHSLVLSVRVTHNSQHQADVTKYTTWVCFYESLPRLSMLKLEHVVPLIPFFWIIVRDSFVITNSYTSIFMPGKQHFTCAKSEINVSRSQVNWNLISLLLNHSEQFQRMLDYLLSHSECNCNCFLRLVGIFLQKHFQFRVFV